MIPAVLQVGAALWIVSENTMENLYHVSISCSFFKRHRTQSIEIWKYCRCIFRFPVETCFYDEIRNLRSCTLFPLADRDAAWVLPAPSSLVLVRNPRHPAEEPGKWSVRRSASCVGVEAAAVASGRPGSFSCCRNSQQTFSPFYSFLTAASRLIRKLKFLSEILHIYLYMMFIILTTVIFSVTMKILVTRISIDRTQR